MARESQRRRITNSINKAVMGFKVETPFGIIERDIKGNDLVLRYNTEDFSDMMGDKEELIDLYLIDNGYKILDKHILFNDPVVPTMSYIYFNEETDDYEEIDIELQDSTLNAWGSFTLQYTLNKA